MDDEPEEKVYAYMLWMESLTDENAVHMWSYISLEKAKKAGMVYAARYGDEKEQWSNDGSKYWYLGSRIWIEKAELH